MSLQRLILFIFLLLVCQASIAQRRTALEDFYMANSSEGSRFLQRIAVSGGKHFITGKAHVNFTGFAGTSTVNDSFEVNLRSRESYAFSIGTYIPLAIISDNSMLVANIELLATTTLLGHDSIEITPSRKVQGTYNTYRAAMPVSLEYRVGGDIPLNKNEATMFGIGAGIAPSIINSDDYNRNVPVKLVPFVKAEIGFFAGLAIKARATINFGQTEYGFVEKYNVANSQPNLLSTRFKGGYGYTLSLVIMPFSFMWAR